MSLKGFNLLKKQVAPPTAWEKIYTWVLGTARVIVIIAELVVVVAFVTRIVVDTQGSRLDKKLKNREATLGAFSESEAKYRSIQNRASNYQTLWENSSNYTPALKELDTLLSGGFSDLSISITDGVVTVRGVGDVSRIDDLEKSLKQSTYFSNVETFEIDTTSQGDRRGNVGLRAVINNYNKRVLE